MKNDPQFRLARESDVGTLLRFMREYYAFDGHGFEEQKAHVALMALLRDPSLGRAWLILDGAGAVGYVVLCFGYSLEWLGRDAFVDELYLLEEYRRRGWGRKTMEFVEQEARAAGRQAGRRGDRQQSLDGLDAPHDLPRGQREFHGLGGEYLGARTGDV